jgi:Arc/MetJ family transcription regulator
MKTTVDIDDELLKAAKKAAIDEGITLREFLEDALRARLGSAVAPGIYGGFASRGELYDEATQSILDDIRAAARRIRKQKGTPSPKGEVN